MCFQMRSFPALWAVLELKVANREFLGSHFDAILGVDWICENRCFMSAPAPF